MKFFVVALLMLTSFGSRAESNTGPQLISYYDLIALPPMQRAKYIGAVAYALNNFEIFTDLDLMKAGVAANDPLPKANPYAFEFFKDLNILEIVLPSAAASDTQYPGYVCYDWTGNCNYYCPTSGYVPAYSDLRSSMFGARCKGAIPAAKMAAVTATTANKPTADASKTVPAADGKAGATGSPLIGPPAPPAAPPGTAGATPAANCTSDPKILETNRQKFGGSQAQHPPNSCMIGGMMSQYSGTRVTRGGCQPPKLWGGKPITCPASDAAPGAAPGATPSKAAPGSKPKSSSAQKAQTLCNPLIYCKQDGSQICKPISQNTAHSCADATPDPTKCAKNLAKPAAADAWKDLSSGITELCGKDGAKVLYCYECSTVKAKIAAACAEAKKTNPSTDCSGAGKGNQIPGTGTTGPSGVTH